MSGSVSRDGNTIVLGLIVRTSVPSFRANVNQ
jgi:hypothetical protein